MIQEIGNKTQEAHRNDILYRGLGNNNQRSVYWCTSSKLYIVLINLFPLVQINNGPYLSILDKDTFSKLNIPNNISGLLQSQ